MLNRRHHPHCPPISALRRAALILTGTSRVCLADKVDVDTDSLPRFDFVHQPLDAHLTFAMRFSPPLRLRPSYWLIFFGATG